MDMGLRRVPRLLMRYGSWIASRRSERTPFLNICWNSQASPRSGRTVVVDGGSYDQKQSIFLNYLKKNVLSASIRCFWHWTTANVTGRHQGGRQASVSVGIFHSELVTPDYLGPLTPYFSYLRGKLLFVCFRLMMGCSTVLVLLASYCTLICWATERYSAK